MKTCRPPQTSRTIRGYEAEYLQALCDNKPWHALQAKKQARHLAETLGLPTPLWCHTW